MDQLGELPADQIVAVRLASIPDDVDAAKATTVDRVLPTMEGPLDHVKLITHLQKVEFKGPVSPGASSTRYKGTTRESIVQKAQEAVDGIFKAAGLHVAPLPMDLIEDIPYEPNPVG
jgi:hypothetical protein